MKKRRTLLRLARLATLPLVALGLVVAGAAPGCYGATEIDVSITTTVPCPSPSSLTTQIFTGATGTKDFGTAPAAETEACGAAEPRVGTLSVLPTGARDDQFDLEVVGAVGVSNADCRDASLGRNAAAPGAIAASATTGCIVARRRVSFRPHKALTVPVLLSARCIGVPCGVDQTCDLGVCTSTVDCTDEGCPRERAEISVDDAGSDARIVDASTDAPADGADADADAGIDASPPRCRAAAEVVIDGQSIVGQLALDGTDFFYANVVGQQEYVRRVPRAGGTATTVGSTTGLTSAAARAGLFASAGSSGTGAARSTVVLRERATPPNMYTTISGVDAVTLAFSNDTLVGFARVLTAGGVTEKAFAIPYAPTGGGTATFAALTVPGDVPEILVDDSGEFYGVAGATALEHYGLVGTTPTRVGSFAIAGTVVPDIALAARVVYAAIAPTDLALPRGIHAIPRGTITEQYVGTPWLVVPPGPQPQSMTSDGTSLYYLIGTTLFRAPIMTAAPPVGAPIATTGAAADRLQVDDQCVYWVEGGTRIMKRAK